MEVLTQGFGSDKYFTIHYGQRSIEFSSQDFTLLCDAILPIFEQHCTSWESGDSSSNEDPEISATIGDKAVKLVWTDWQDDYPLIITSRCSLVRITLPSEEWTTLISEFGQWRDEIQEEIESAANNSYDTCGISQDNLEINKMIQVPQKLIVEGTENTQKSSQVNPTSESQINDAIVCKVCLVKDRGTVFLPCGHVVACVQCARNLSICVVCRTKISMTVRVYLS